MNALKKLAEYLPASTTSQYAQKGTLTAEEFVLACDNLCAKCPQWQWSRGSKEHAKAYLPPDKQFLLLKGAPSVRRKEALALADVVGEALAAAGDEGDAWLDTNAGEASQTAADIPPSEPAAAAPAEAAPVIDLTSHIREPAEDDEDVPDIEEFDGQNLATTSGPVLTATEPVDDNILKTRSYDVSITYDKYYQVPHVYLFGYDEARRPLQPSQLFEDVSQDHAEKTVTIENHPHMSNIAHASIHPCRHASAMKRLADIAAASGKEIRVDMYMFTFLKFIACIVPTIEFDLLEG
eukprot:tig00020614_g12219.t1